MGRSKVLLVLLVASILLPVAAKADTLQLGFNGGLVNITTGIGTGFITNDPSVSVGTCGAAFKNTCSKPSNLSTIGTLNTGIQFGPGALGSVIFTSGTALSRTLSGNPNSNKYSQVVYGSGGNIVVMAGTTITGAGGTINPGTVLFSGVFSSSQTLAMVNPLVNFGPFSLTGQVTTTVLNPILLADLGLPFLGGGSFSSIVLDVSFSLNGASVNSGMISLVPEPGTLALFGTGLIGLAGLVRRRLK